MDGLVEAAREVYAAPPAEFVAARDRAVRSARSDGAKDLAKAVAALRKPGTGAWVVNALVRERPDDLAQLLDLGRRLRAAQAARSGDDLRTLDREQRAAMAAVLTRARDRAAESGQAVSGAVAEKVEATLRAAMTDPDAARAVATGLLVRELESSGFGGVDLEGAVAVDGAPPLDGAPVADAPGHEVDDEPAITVRAGGRPGRRDPTAGGPPPRRTPEDAVTLPGSRSRAPDAGGRRPPRPPAAGSPERAGDAAPPARRPSGPARAGSATGARPATEPDAHAERRRSEARQAADQAEREAAEADGALAEARAAAEKSAARVAELAAAHDEVTARLEELTRREAELRAEQQRASGDARRARGAVTSAEKVAAGAARRAAAARAAAESAGDGVSGEPAR